MHKQTNVAISADGVPVHYEVQGNRPTALVFVHGWCCNRRYWDNQVGHFAPSYTVVTIDLGGHGASGQGRKRWTMSAFGQDVTAVVERLGLDQVVLIGHSMGGSVIVEAARGMPESVIGLVGVDTLKDVSQIRTPAQVEERMAPFRTNFVEAARTFVRGMFVPTSDVTLIEDIVAKMLTAPSNIGISAAEENCGNDQNLQEGLKEINAPIFLINSAQRPPFTNMEAAQAHGIEVKLMSGVGHFVMMEDAETFNRLLDEAVEDCVRARALS